MHSQSPYIKPGIYFTFRMMYVPVAQNVRADLPFLGNVRMYQRGEIFYYVFHSVILTRVHYSRPHLNHLV